MSEKKTIKPSFEATRQQLEARLTQSAFRRGTSAFRLGLIPQGVSDHLPIAANISTSQQSIKLVSWNLLADQHLYNNFMNISGSQLLVDALLTVEPKSPYNHRSIYHFFIELSRYLHAKCQRGKIVVDEATLNSFIEDPAATSILMRARSEECPRQKKASVIEAREKLIAIMLDQSHPQAHEFKLAIRHALEIYHHIKGSENDLQPGELNWENRLTRLQQNDALQQQISSADIICLQECTTPDAICDFITVCGKTIEVLTHRVNDRTNDHCVLMYDSTRFDCVSEPIFAGLENKTKPCIFATLKDKSSGECIIVGSIHHPGGDKYCLSEIEKHIQALQPKSPPGYSYCIAGDFNHCDDFFELKKEVDDQHLMHYPQQGTMAGSDYGNVNRAIDAMMSDLSADNIQVSRMDDLPACQPAPSVICQADDLQTEDLLLHKDKPIILEFKYQDERLLHVAPSFMHPVQRVISASKETESCRTGLGLSMAGKGPAIRL